MCKTLCTQEARKRNYYLYVFIIALETRDMMIRRENQRRVPLPPPFPTRAARPPPPKRHTGKNKARATHTLPTKLQPATPDITAATSSRPLCTAPVRGARRHTTRAGPLPAIHHHKSQDPIPPIPVPFAQGR